jgi:phosphoribosylanthranilate isomerase
MTAIKFCGLTRRGDVAFATEVGATYVGVIFAGGPRNRTVEQAARMLRNAPHAASHPEPYRSCVGVFGAATPSEIAKVAAAVPLDIVQLHDVTKPAMITTVRTTAARPVWAVIRCDGDRIPLFAGRMAQVADALVLDTRVAGKLGGTGVPLPWAALAEAIAEIRPPRLVLAGGLTPENVGAAIAAIHPDVVDVSSGVERAPGIKDHARMRAFAEAVAAADAATPHMTSGAA